MSRRFAVAALVVLAIVVTVPGVHLLELWMPRMPARVISHGAGLAILGSALLHWRRTRTQAHP